MMFDLEGKVAIVTGGNGGIGLAMVEALIAAGARVAIAARAGDKAQAALAGLSRPERAIFVPVDVASKASCVAMVAAVEERLGRLDVLVCNAGMTIRKLPQDLTEEDWRTVLDVNLSGAFFCAQAAWPAMVRQGGGKIITLGSMYSLFGAPMVAAYAASKGGVAQLTKALAAAWASDNIQVNAILPGWVDTDLTRTARDVVPGLEGSVVERTPAGRWGEPRDLAGITVFLASGAADFITGTLIPVDGGYSSRG